MGIDETSEWCSCFVLVPKSNGKIHLCLDLNSLNKALIRPVQRDPTSNAILPRLTGIKYLTSIDVSLGYHNLKLDAISPYITMYIRLLFGDFPAGDIFQKKIDEFSGIADGILIAGYDKQGKDHD